MKVEVKRVFFDAKGLHKVGEIAEVDFFDEKLMSKIAEKAEPKQKKEISKK